MNLLKPVNLLKTSDEPTKLPVRLKNTVIIQTNNFTVYSFPLSESEPPSGNKTRGRPK